MQLSRKSINSISPKEDIKSSFLFWGILLFFLSLNLIYPIFSQDYGMYGFEYKPDKFRYTLASISVCTTAGLIWSMISIKKPSSILLFILYLMAFLPNMSLYANMSLPHSFFVMSNIYWFLMIFSYKILNTGNVKEIKYTKNKLRNSYFVFWFFAIIIILYKISYSGISFTIDLADVYDLRMANRERSFNFIMKRLVPWSANIIFPIGIIYSIKHRKYLMAGFLVFAVVAAFSMNGTKTWLFISVLSLLAAIFITKEKRLRYIPVILSAVTLMPLFIKNSFFVQNFIIRRVFFTTSLNNYYWLDFFEHNPKMYLTNSILAFTRHIGISRPYDDIPAAQVIGDIYYNDPTTNAASGTMAEAYAGFGWLGVFIYPPLIIASFRLLDKVSTHVSVVYLLPIIISAGIYLLNGGIISAFLLGGYLFGVIFIYYYNRRGMFIN